MCGGDPTTLGAHAPTRGASPKRKAAQVVTPKCYGCLSMALLNLSAHLCHTQHLILIHVQLPRDAADIFCPSNAHELKPASQGFQLLD
jgi:hypothetical protein